MNIQTTPSQYSYHHAENNLHNLNKSNDNDYAEDDWSDNEWNSKPTSNSNSIKGMELRSLIPKNQNTTKSTNSNSSYSAYTIKENYMER